MAIFTMTETLLLNNRYELQELLGSGGMSVVYHARDRMLERDVAIKILRESFTGDPIFRDRFHQEAKAAANLSHPNIVTIHDFGLDAGRLFIVMEYVPGDHLKDLIRKRGRLPLNDALALMIQACSGIGYAHRAGLVHCDIKPHNMLITPDMRLKVADFGIARALASIHPEEKVDVVWGSPQYFSPEQASGAAPSPASDVYSLGVVMFEMLTGQLPFSAASADELARLHRELPPPSPSQLNQSIPPGLEQILLKVLAKEPATRYRTADQLGRVLVSYTSQSTAAATAAIPAFPLAAEPPKLDQTKASPTQAASLNRPVVSAPVPSRRSGEPASGHPAGQSSPYRPPQSVSVANQAPEENPLTIDWITISLGLLALIAVGGLLPFYLWVFFLYR
jgi:serine/threonine-protein kinase